MVVFLFLFKKLLFSLLFIPNIIIFIGSLASLTESSHHCEIVMAFFMVYVVPILDEMPSHVYHGIALDMKSNIMPRHPWFSFSINWGMFNLISGSRWKGSQSLVRIISSIPQIIFVIDIMIRGVPSTITDIKPSHKPISLINNT